MFLSIVVSLLNPAEFWWSVVKRCLMGNKGAVEITYCSLVSGGAVAGFDTHLLEIPMETFVNVALSKHFKAE